MNAKKILIQTIPYLFVALYATKLGEAWRLTEGADASQKLLHITQGFSAAFQSPFPSFAPFDLLIGCIPTSNPKTRRNTVRAWNTAPPAGALRRT